MRPVRVALVGPFPYGPTRARGGVETSFRNLLSGLAERPDTEPHVVTFAPGLRGPESASVDDVPVRYLPDTRRLANLTLRERERRLLRAALDEIRPDVVHAQDAVRYGFLSLRSGVRAPVVVSVHGIVHEEVKYVDDRVARLRTRVASMPMERYCLRRAEFLVAPTRYAEQYFGDRVRGRLWDIGNPIAEAFFAVEAAPDPGRILYTGALIARKRLLDLVEALPRVARSVPEAHVRVVGGAIDPVYADRVRERVRELALDDRVTLVGGVDFGELLDEYRRASLLVLPSGEETSPMVIGEAMAVGVPAVATRVGGVSYLVDEGTTGYLVDVGDVQALADRVVLVLGDPGHGAALGAAARTAASGRFRVGAVAERVRGVYEEVLGIARAQARST